MALTLLIARSTLINTINNDQQIQWEMAESFTGQVLPLFSAVPTLAMGAGRLRESPES